MKTVSPNIPGSGSQSNPPFVEHITPAKRNQLAHYRGWRRGFVDLAIADHKVGVISIQGKDYWAFPVLDGQGQLVSVHYERGRTEPRFLFEPKGHGAPPFVIGDVAKADMLHLTEGEWDALSLAQMLDFYTRPDRESVAIISTLGAGSTKGVTELLAKARAQAKIYAWTQGDNGSVVWLNNLAARAAQAGVTFLVARPPFQDQNQGRKFNLNDALKAGAGCGDIAHELGLATTPPPPATQTPPPASQQAPPPSRQLRGASIIDYAERPIDLSKNILGHRWLSRGSGAFIVAPSGHGKSTLAIQTAICWSCGRVAFALKPQQPLRILIVQSEDDSNDMIEMARMCRRLKLTAAEADLVRQNTHLEQLNDVVGDNLFPVLDNFLDQFPCDLLILNPYTAYQGGELVDDELNNRFLRQNLSAFLEKHDCAALLIHHTPKTSYQNTDKFEWFDWMYSMAGGAALTNWARGVLVIAPSEKPGTYRFIAAKRFEKTGWQEREYWFAHSVDNDGVILWVPATHEQIALGKKARTLALDDILAFVPLLDPISQDEFFHKCRGRIGVNSARTLINTLIDQKKVHVWKIKRAGRKGSISYCQSEQSDDAEE